MTPEERAKHPKFRLDLTDEDVEIAERHIAEFQAKVANDETLAERDRLAGVVEMALSDYDCVGGMPWDEVADIAVKALLADGWVAPERYLIPVDLMNASLKARVKWLRLDVERDDMMCGTPRYRRRYTERESEMVGLLGAMIDELRGS